MATIRITKTMRFEDIKALLNGEEVKHGTSPAEAIEFIEKEMALVAKKNSGTGKMTPEQKLNEELKEKMVAYMATHSKVTCNEVFNAIPDFIAGGYANQKTAALMRQLKLAGVVDSVKEKDKTLFFLV